MLEELFNLVKGYSTETVVNNPQVPNEQNNAVIAEATNTVASGLRNMVAGGGLQSILSLFSNGGSDKNSLLNNPIVNMMMGHFTGKLMNKYNLEGAQASAVSNNLIPNVISGLIDKTNDPNNSSFSIENLLNSITGGQSTVAAQEEQSGGNSGFNFQDLFNKTTNGTQDNAGGGLMDIVSKLASGAQSQQQKNGSGGLMDLIQGFLK